MYQKHVATTAYGEYVVFSDMWNCTLSQLKWRQKFQIHLNTA